MKTKKTIKTVGRFKSRTEPDAKHTVKLVGAGLLRCTCKGFTYAGHCWHIDEVRQKLNAKGIRARRDVRPSAK